MMLAENVYEFIDRAAALRSQALERRFAQEMHCACLELGMQSPIEHMFWVAANVLCESHCVPLNPEPVFISGEDGKDRAIPRWGIYITPQHKVEKYTVDFLITQDSIGPDLVLGPVVVELDGHDFHDKDKRQRSYEKARDRFLVAKGYRVLHFTGSDVVADPFKVAFEALELVGCFVGTGVREYDKSDPLAIGV